MASAAIIDEYGFHSTVVRTVLRQTRGPFGPRELLVEIGERRKHQIHLLFGSARESNFRRGDFKADGLRPNLILADVHGRKRISPALIRVYRGCERLTSVPSGDADSLQRLSVRGLHSPRQNSCGRRGLRENILRQAVSPSHQNHRNKER